MPKELLKVSTTLRGKMKGMTVITSSCTDNPHCKKLSKIEGAICTHCYAQRGLSYMRGPREAYVKNGKILSTERYSPLGLFPEMSFRLSMLLSAVWRVMET